MVNDPQVPWTDDQWGRVNQVIQEEAKRARVAATFLPLYGPLSADADFVRGQRITYPFIAGVAGPQQLAIDDRDTIRLATLQVQVPVRNAQMADPEMTSVLALFRRAANVLARIEDAVIFRGIPPQGVTGVPSIWRITGALPTGGLWTQPPPPRRNIVMQSMPFPSRGQRLVTAVSNAIGQLERNGHFGPFAVVLGQRLYLIAQTPNLLGSFILPQESIVPFLGGGQLLRSSTLDELGGFTGLVIALGGAPIEVVVATDACLQFLQITAEPAFLFRVSEKIALRIKEPDAIIQLYMR